MSAVTVRVEARDCDGFRYPPTFLTYDEAFPFAVTLTVEGDPANPVRWVFGRDLLTAGMVGLAGIGQVTVAPFGGAVAITLSGVQSSGAKASVVLYLPADEVAEFLERSGHLVPDESDDPALDVELFLWLEASC